MSGGVSCGAGQFDGNSKETVIETGAEQLNEYLPLIRNKTIAIVANQTSIVDHIHLVDTLQKLNIDIKLVFAPEHGFRGEAEAGEDFSDSKDAKSGLPLKALYGNHLKPTTDDLKGVQMVVFDIQDVGARFYTYISTLQYVMEACAENKLPLLVLDRPNPNGNYVDGPILDTAFKSFVGMNAIPVVHGLTMAEYALMLNGEGWLTGKKKCELFYVKAKNWNHNSVYELPVPPSPNLPNMTSVYLYPSLCFFEGTIVSVGRGTMFPFQVLGYPGFTGGSFSFIPMSIKGKSLKPLYEGKECKGYDLREFGNQYIANSKQLYLFWLIESYKNAVDKSKFFNKFFDTLAGSKQLRLQIIDGESEEDIRKSWKAGINDYKVIRKKYLLYKDFE